MALIQISRPSGAKESSATTPHVPTLFPEFFSDGFRSFFLGSLIYAIWAMGSWMLAYQGHRSGQNYHPLDLRVSMTQWHAYQFVFGYSMGVIGGFLLTALPNWTGRRISRTMIASLFTLWAIARVGSEFDVLRSVASIFDMVFVTGLFLLVGREVIQTKQWQQSGILSKLLLLALANISFYGTIYGFLSSDAQVPIYAALYLIVSLILTIVARVVPIYIERTLHLTTPLPRLRIIGVLTLVTYLLFFVNELFFHVREVQLLSAIFLAALLSIRLWNWHRPQLWKAPLLWGIFLAPVWIAVGFLCIALSHLVSISPFTAIHAFTAGAIGTATLAMMMRVTLGHGGGNVLNPIRGTGIALLLMAVSAALRVGAQPLYPEHYVGFIATAQLLWIAAMLTVLICYHRQLLGLVPTQRQ